jgi:hypothetical protein
VAAEDIRHLQRGDTTLAQIGGVTFMRNRSSRLFRQLKIALARCARQIMQRQESQHNRFAREFSGSRGVRV